MNLPDSSSSSKRSSAKPAATAQGRSRQRQPRKDLDLPLKLQVASALARNEYYALVNVALSAIDTRGLADVTDIDVFATRYDLMFRPSTIAVSCKAGESRSLSPAREIFYVKGVLDYIRAANGVVAFSRRPVAAHLRDLGRRLGVLVLSGGEVDAWCNSLVNGIADFGYFKDSFYEAYLQAWARANMPGLVEYLQSDYWFHFDFRNLQNVIGHLKKVAASITGEQPWHAIIVLDTAAHLCLVLFDLCREILLLGASSVSETTAAYLFGGAPSFRARRDLYSRVQQLLSSTGVLSSGGPSLPPLEPPYAPQLAELAVRLIERPQAAVRIPHILQDELWRALGASGAPPRDETNILAAEKLAQDLLTFLKTATGAKWVPRI